MYLREWKVLGIDQRQRRRLTLENKIVLGPEVKADNAPDADRDGSLAKPAL